MNPRITYYPNGNIKYLEYIKDYEYHNANGPAVIFFHENGKKYIEEYRLNGIFHNIKGSALINYDENENIKKEDYYINGQRIDVNSIEEFKRHLKLLSII